MHFVCMNSPTPDFADRLNHVWASMKIFATLIFAILIFALLLGSAFAQGAAEPLPAPVLAPAMSVFDLIKTNFLSPAGLAGLVLTVLGIIGKFAWATEKRKRVLALAVKNAFHIVEDVGNELDGEDNFDKAARGLLEADKWMVANGWRAMTAQETAVAKLELQAKHGEEIAKAKVLSTAAVAVDAVVAEAAKVIEAATTDANPSAP